MSLVFLGEIGSSNYYFMKSYFSNCLTTVVNKVNIQLMEIMLKMKKFMVKIGNNVLVHKKRV